MKIMVALLTHHSVDRLARLVDSLQQQRPVEGVEVVPVIVVNSTNGSHYGDVIRASLPYPVIATNSNGKPGRGKNSCLDIFLRSDCDYISQIDGDDMLYPTYLQSLVAHIRHYPCIDVLGIIPADKIDRNPVAGHQMQLRDDVHAGVWGVSLVPASQEAWGPGRSHIWDEELPSSRDFIILQSRKSALHKMHETIGVGEDHLYTYQLLSSHQRGDLAYFLTMSSDMYLIDTTTDNSVQKDFPQHEHVQELRDQTLLHVREDRSSADELPVIYKDLKLNQFEKEEWIREITTTHKHIWS